MDTLRVSDMTNMVLDAAVHSENNVGPQSKLESLEAHANALQDLIDWRPPELTTQALIRGRMVLSCLPSLRVTAAGRAHDLDTANEVLTNLVELADFVQRDDRINGRDKHTRGIISEFSVLAVGWWAVTKHKLPPTSHVSPANRRMDASSWDKESGGRTGADVFLKEGRTEKYRSGRKHLIQVKSSYGKNSVLYSPKIPVVVVSRCVPEQHRRRAGQAILQGLRGESEGILPFAWEQIRTELDKTPAQRKAERAHLLPRRR